MLGLLWLAALVSAEPELPPAPAFFAGNEELYGYIVEALRDNPEIAARHAEWLAALERVPQVTLDDPMFSLNSFLQSDIRYYVAQLTQAFPWFGTLRAQRNVAAAEARAALARVSVTRNQIIADVKRAYYDLGLIGEQSALVESQADIYDYIENTTLSRYGVGLARQEDVYRVQMAKAQLQDRLEDLTQLRPAVEAQLLEAMGASAAAGDMPPPGPAELPPPPPPPPVVLARVASANPELEAIDERIDARGYDIALARKTGYPDFTVGMSYSDTKEPRGQNFNQTALTNLGFGLVRQAPSQGVGTVLSNVGADLAKQRLVAQRPEREDEVTVLFRVSLPVWRGRVRAVTREAVELQRAAEREKEQTGLALTTAARMALYNYQSAQRQYDLYENVLLPQAELIYEDLQTGYGLGEMGDFVDLLESVNTLIEFQLSQVRAKTDLQNAAAELERLMGGPWAGEAIKPEAVKPEEAE